MTTVTFYHSDHHTLEKLKADGCQEKRNRKRERRFKIGLEQVEHREVSLA